MNVKINRIEYYHPETVYTNDYFHKHFEEKGENIHKLLKITGRKNRFISTDENETSLTMAIAACKKVLEKANINKDDIGYLLYISQTPEFFVPTNAVKIHKELGLHHNILSFDMNCNCAGMVVGLEQAARYLKTNNRVKYALVVGSDQLFRYARESEAMAYSNFGESACAILLENTESGTSDFIDSCAYTDSSLHDTINFPPNGLSKVLATDEFVERDNKIIEWIGFETDRVYESAINSINDLINRNNLTKDDIKLYCLSQFVKKHIDDTRIALDEPEEKFPFVGDVFGYTGTTSPLMALTNAIEENKIKRGDHVILWTVGAGVCAPCVLLKY